ncbi:MAG: NosD domain-containing protein [Halobacteriota archaeon]
MKRISIGRIFVILIFLGIAFVPSSGMSEDNAMEKWMQDHTLKVNLTTTCKYEQGYLLVKEVYTGEELKERFGIEQFTKELKIPVEAKVLAEGKLRGMQEGEEKVFVTEKVTVLTSEGDPPHWWDEYKYPQWIWFKSGDVYEKGLPINLAWKNTTKDMAKSEILEEGWVDNPIQWTEYVYDPINGWIIGDGVATSTFGIFGRYHANLWQMSDGNAVANTHHDTPVPHEADELEGAEELVAGYFAEPDDTEWRVYEDSYNLDNNVTSPYSDGWCTQINYGSATWYVPDNHVKIQWAVDNATAGDTIIVRNGTYYENVFVNKSITLRGEDKNNTIINGGIKGNQTKPVIEVEADDCMVSDFTVMEGYRGISLNCANNCTITNNTVKDCKYIHISPPFPVVIGAGEGIYLDFANNNTIIGNEVSHHLGACISASCSSRNTIGNNLISLNNGGAGNIGGEGICFYNSTDSIIEDNSILDNPNMFGIRFIQCSNNNVSNNSVLNNTYGIYLEFSNNHTLKNNRMSGNSYNFGTIGYEHSHFIHKIDTSNTVKGKPAYYWMNEHNKQVPSDAGFVGIVNSTNITVRDLTLTNNYEGVLLAFSNNSRIENVTTSDNYYGIWLSSSSRNTLIDNTANSKNTKGDGIHLDSSTYNTLTNNTASNNYYGIRLDSSSHNTLTDNTMSDNKYNFDVFGSNLSHYIQNIDTNNLVDGRQIFYWVDQQNQQVPSNAGFVGIVNSTNITVRDLTLTNNYEGLLLAFSNSSMIKNVTVSDSHYGIRLDSSSNNTLANIKAFSNLKGIRLDSSSNNTLTNNNVSNNNFGIYLWHSIGNTITNNIISNDYGIELEDSSNNTITNNYIINNDGGICLWFSSNNNKIYFNNFINNSDGIFPWFGLTTIWNSTEKITYTYNGSTYINYLGNYWDDYKEKYPDAEEVDGTGIWNTPYSIDSDNDGYPLVGPFENYVVPTENIFDTGASANPYPSIFGTHNGTIKPNVTIEVSKLYTYPCAGTGGHTEYAMIWNKTIGECAVAEWDGYIGDYHNISFNKTLTLEEGVIYNYTIQTGSYPQIIHETTFNATGGTITCDKFIDANGKIYTDWIPVIMLWEQ